MTPSPAPTLSPAALAVRRATDPARTATTKRGPVPNDDALPFGK